MDRLVVPLGRYGHQKVQVLWSPRPLTRKKVSPLVWGPLALQIYRVFSNRGPKEHLDNDNLHSMVARGSEGQVIQKKALQI